MHPVGDRGAAGRRLRRRSAPAACSPAWALAAVGFLVGLARRRRPRRPRSTSGPATRSARCSLGSAWRTRRRSTRRRRRSSGSSGSRASCSPRSSAGCSRSRARRTRASSTTRSPIRTSSASRPVPGLGATLAISYLPRALAGQQLLPVAAFLGGAAAVVVTWAISRSAGRERDADDVRARRRRRRELLHRGADVRAAAELRHAAGGLLVDPRRAPELGLERRRGARPVRHRRDAS